MQLELFECSPPRRVEVVSAATLAPCDFFDGFTAAQVLVGKATRVGVRSMRQ